MTQESAPLSGIMHRLWTDLLLAKVAAQKERLESLETIQGRQLASRRGREVDAFLAGLFSAAFLYKDFSDSYEEVRKQLSHETFARLSQFAQGFLQFQPISVGQEEPAAREASPVVGSRKESLSYGEQH